MNTNSSNKRTEEAMSKETPTPPTKNLSREARKRRNKRLKWEREHEHEQNEPIQIPEEKIPPVSDLSTELNTFDPSRHKTQPESRKLTKEDTQQYILSRWVSEDFLASDLRTSNNEQSAVYTDPRLTFQEKFLEKRRQRLVVRELFDQWLLQLNTIKPDTDNDSKKSLAPYCTQPIPTSFEFPAKFMDLLETEVFNRRDSSASSELERSKSSWEKFALWACFKIGPNYILQHRRHCHLLWTRTLNVYQHEAQNKPLEGHKINEIFLRNPKDKLYIADETTKEVISGNKLGRYYHISDSQCLKNSFEETIVDFFDLDNQTAVGGARIAVDQYYQHTIAHPSHLSKQFAKDLIEHFGGFADSNNLPCTAANTASSHREEHQKCVRDLIKGLRPLSNAVNKYLETTYPALYLKMTNLDLGPNIPKLFGAFPPSASIIILSVNFTVI
ncbi:1147_t:CDS:2 [Diversispora eburnea]|uniref:1147_t:CDS:1 n=1 Tax=Diversispora eburnea TaxID=1213867 RepID=A0A9N9G9B2_9GLOM|nr:1147_t:CDS:2 [Diversispora eburnea]